MTDHVFLRPGAYADSVALLQVSKDVAALDGVVAAQVAMATDLNRDVIAQMGFDLPAATANDMLVAIRVVDPARLEAALAAVDTALAKATRRGEHGAGVVEPPRTTGSALSQGDAGLALVSVPGASAAVEAMDALDAGRDVMIFSDNVPVAHEVALKQAAADRGLLVMGPDCGTAMIDGVGLGFANAVSPGPVGIVAASGTGCQQLMSLLDYARVGVSAALGVGGRDLSADVGALATREALRRLDADDDTSLIVVVSKPAAPEVARDLRAFAGRLATPVTFAVLSPEQPSLTAAAEAVLAAVGHELPTWPRWGQASAIPGSTGGARYLRGLYAGGTLCDEAMLLVAGQLGPVWSNVPLDAAYELGPELTADGTIMIDFGDDGMTTGRAHPMIDPTLRLDYLARTARDPATAVIVLDVVLGHGAESDPAASLAPAIEAAVTSARHDGRDLRIVVACVGTDLDPQRLTAQAQALAASGAEVYLSNAQATTRALSLIGAHS